MNLQHSLRETPNAEGALASCFRYDTVSELA